MIAMLFRTWLPALLLLSAPVAARVPYGGASAAPAPAAQARGYQPVGWTQAVEDPAALRAEIGRLEADLRVRGAAVLQDPDFVARLAAARRAACSQEPFEGQADALRLVALLRSEAFAAAGRDDDARAALAHPAPDSSEVDLATGAVLASTSLTAAVAAVRAAPDVAARLRELRAPAAPAAENEATLEQIVVDAAERSDWNQVRAIGPRAAPTLVRLALASGTLPPRADQDPLYGLIQLDARLAGRILRDHWSDGAYLWHRRILRATAATQVLEDAALWAAPVEQALRLACLEPAWLEVVARLVEDEATRDEALTLVRPLAERDALSPALAAELASLVRQDPDKYAGPIGQTIPERAVCTSAEPVLTALLESTQGPTRMRAARALADLPRSEALLGLAEDPDPALRRLVVDSLSPIGENLTRWTDATSRGPFRYEPFERDVHESDRDLVQRWIEDPDSGVRLAAIALGLEKGWLDSETCLHLAEDRRLDTFEVLVKHWRQVPEDALPTILGWYASVSRAASGGEIEKQVDLPPIASVRPEALGPALVERCKEGHDFQVSTELQSTFDALVETSTGRAVAARAVVANGTTRYLEVLENALRGAHIAQDKVLNVASVLDLDDSLLEPLLALASRGSTGSLLTQLALNCRDWAGSRPSVASALAGDARATIELRCDCIAYLASTATEDATDHLLALARDPAVAAAKDLPTRSLQYALEGLPVDERERLQLAVLGDPSVADRVARAFVARIDASGPDGAQLVAAVLDRWLDAPGDAVLAALDELPRVPAVATPERLRRALQDPDAADRAVHAMGRIRDPAMLPLLGDCLDPTWLRDETYYRMIGIDAANAIGGYFTDAAGTMLLRGLQVSDQKVRAAASDALTAIEEARDRRQAWEERGRDRPTRESAVADLLELLGSENPDIRAAAARGLGTLGAVETLPKLIGLLEDPAPPVVEAARAALEDLRARRTVPAGGDEK